MLYRVVEMSVGVICGSVPWLPALVKRYKPFSRVASMIRLLHPNSWAASKKSSELSPGKFDRVGSNSSTPEKMRVETRVLGSIKGYVYVFAQDCIRASIFLDFTCVWKWIETLANPCAEMGSFLAHAIFQGPGGGVVLLWDP
jgi:hypothetical protein